MGKSKDTGLLGEELAAAQLLAQGYHILHRNWRFKKKEVDLIAMHGEELVFIEVKTRMSFEFGFPEDAVHEKKKAFLKEAARGYCDASATDYIIRFDIISVLIADGLPAEILHFKDAFY